MTHISLEQLLKLKEVQVLPNASTVIWNAKLGYNAELTLNGNKTLELSQFEKGDYGTIKIIQDNTGGRSLTLPLNSKVFGGGLGVLPLSITGNAVDIATVYFDGTNLYWNLSTDFS